MSALEDLAAAKTKTDARSNFETFIAGWRAAGWSEAETADYQESIRIFLGDDDSAALALLPAGSYKSSEQARRSAWKCRASFLSA